MKNEIEKNIEEFKTRRSRATLGAAAMVTCVLGGCAVNGAGPASEAEDQGSASSAIYYKASAIWGNPAVPVCWENPSAASDTERGWVRDAVAVTWEGRSNLQLTGWGGCSSSAKGIRIRIADEWPRTTALGSELDGVSGGMILNFVYTF